MAEVFNMEIEAGETCSWSVTDWRDEDGNLVDLTGATAKMHFKLDYDQDAIVELSETSGITIGDPGAFSFSLTPAQTELLGGDDDVKGVYDLVFTLGATAIKPIKGKYICHPLSSRTE